VSKRYVLSEYVELAMSQALYDRLEDHTFSGRIPSCPGVLSFAQTLKGCEEELRSTLEDWALVSLKLRHRLPVIGNTDLNKEPAREPVDSL
jgi:predicted RNase H-like HicB family nuclease